MSFFGGPFWSGIRTFPKLWLQNCVSVPPLVSALKVRSSCAVRTITQNVSVVYLRVRCISSSEHAASFCHPWKRRLASCS